MSIKKVLVLWDFDHTLFFVDGFKRKSAELLALSLGNNLSLSVEEVFALMYGPATYPDGMYILQQHKLHIENALLAYMQDKTDQSETALDVKSKVDACFEGAFDHMQAHPEAFIFEESAEVLRQRLNSISALIEEQGFSAEFKLLSYGEAGFQKRKIDAMHEILQMDVLGSGVEDKVEIVSEIKGYDCVFVVNDRVQETRQMHQTLASHNKSVASIFMLREAEKLERELQDVTLKSDEHIVRNLVDVKTIIGEFLAERKASSS